MSQKKPRNILILTFFSFNDALIQSYVLPYIGLIKEQLDPKSKVFLYTYEQEKFIASPDELAHTKAKLKESEIYLISTTYRKFGLMAFINGILTVLKLFYICKVKRVSHLHTFCMPPGVLGYILSILTNKPLIVDSFEPHAETMLESGVWTKQSFAFKLLFKFESLIAHKAKILIACTKKMEEYAKEKYHYHSSIDLFKPACVDMDLFKPTSDNKLKNKINPTGKIIGVCSGKIGGYYMNEELFDFIKIAQDYWGEKFKMLLLTSTPQEAIKQLALKKGIKEQTLELLFIPYSEMPNYLSIADFAINHTMPIKSRRYGTPIKDGEFWAMGLPVIIPKDISDDSEIIEKHSIGYVLQDLNATEYLNALKQIEVLLHSKSKADIREIAVKYRSYDIARAVYKTVYANEIN